MIRKIFVLDTSALVYDPNCYTSFTNNDVVIPIVVLEELDKVKTFANENGRKARVAIRNLEKASNDGEIHKGIKLSNGIHLKIDVSMYDALGVDKNYGDSKILGCAAHIQKHNPDKKVILVSKDINLRIRAKAFGMLAEDYTKDKISDVDFYTGFSEIKNSEADDAGNGLKDASIISVDDYPMLKFLNPNEFILFTDKNGKGICTGRRIGNDIKIVKEQFPWGLKLRNKEQLFLCDLLLDPNIPLVTVSGLAGSGKAQPLTAKVLTPTGFVNMGDVVPGMLVTGSDGSGKKVMSVHPQGEIDIYRVYFSDGSYTECCDDHLWFTKTSIDRDYKKNGSVKSLRDIRETLRYGKSLKRNHSIPMVEPVNFESKDVKIHPYLLGVILGDGSTRSTSTSITTADQEIVDKVTQLLPRGLVLNKMKHGKYGYNISKTSGHNNILSQYLRELNLYGKKSHKKFIPNEYKINSIECRLEILRGLMDTDGFCSKNGMSSVFYSTSRQLSEDVQFIVQSLGGKAVITNKQTSFTHKGIKKLGRPSYAVHISMPPSIIPFSIERKLSRFKSRSKYPPIRYIDNVQYLGKAQAQCIYIDSVDHLYVTDSFIVTHNTLCAIASALEMVINKNMYDTITIYRPIQPMGSDVGYLPGSLSEKLDPWFVPIDDAFAFLLSDKTKRKDGWKTQLHQYLDNGTINKEALTYIRGRSIPNSLVILDEAQNTSKEEIKTILTRVGINSKVVLTGDIQQIDHNHLDASNNGLTYAVEKFKHSELAGHMTLVKGERSAIATLAAEIL